MYDSPGVSTDSFTMPPLSPLALQMRRVTGSVVGRPAELAAAEKELEVARTGQLTALTFEGEPGIGKTRLLVAVSELAAAEGFLQVAVTADEEIRGPFLLARAIFRGLTSLPIDDVAVQEEINEVAEALAGRQEPGLEQLALDQKLLRVLDMAAMAIRNIAARQPLALLIDDLQWADIDSLRLLRYMVRSASDLPIFLGLAVRPEEMALVTEAETLLADMGRMGMVRRLKLQRFSQMETAELLSQALGGAVNKSSAAAMHVQAEGVPFIIEELARTYRSAGMVQEIEGVWTLAKNAERLVPSAVRTLIERRAARLPDASKSALAEAAILGRTFSLKDLGALKERLGDDEECCSPTQLAEELAPAVKAGLLIELPEVSPGDYRFGHDQVKDFAADTLTAPRRRAIHRAIVDMLTAGGEPDPASLSLLAAHALAAGETERAASFSVDAAKAALSAHAPEEVLRIVGQALAAASTPLDRVALLSAQDEALEMLRRSTERLEGLAELAALAVALRDPHLELEIMLRRAAAFRMSDDPDRAVQVSGDVRRLAKERGDSRAELAACLELGQALLRAPLGESFSPTASEVDLEGAGEAYERARELAEELGDLPALAAATRELGVVEVGRLRESFVETVKLGEHVPIMQRIAQGEPMDPILASLPIAPMRAKAEAYYERAIELFDKIGDRRGVMSSIIAMAYVGFGVDIHFLGSAKRIEEIRRLAGRMKSLTRQSEMGMAEAQMLYGAHVFARDKVVPDLALSRGEEAYQQARIIGDRSLEFATAGGVALVHLELGEIDKAERWLDKAAGVAAAVPTPLRARQIALWRGMARARAGDATGMRTYLERTVRLTSDQGRPAARCEALARLALESARLGARSGDDELLAVAEESSREVRKLMKLLPGRPLWGAQADAAAALVAMARGLPADAMDAARSALNTVHAAEREEDPNLDIMLPVARVMLLSPDTEERQSIREFLRMTLALIAQRTIDEDVRVRWFRGPVGKELAELAGAPEGVSGEAGGPEVEIREAEPAGPSSTMSELSEDDSRLLWLLIEGRTNRDIAQVLGVSDEMVVRRLARMYGRIGVSSRGEATAAAFRERVV
jgi:DNA-binding NarL/FixJ family response regulator